MNDLTGPILLITIVVGITYFWYKCQCFAVSKFLLIMGVLFLPVGVLVGIYWAIKDFFLFRNSKSNAKFTYKNGEKDILENKDTPVTNEMYLNALEEYESKDKDKALFARLYADNDGKEELVKAKYITQRVEQMIKKN